MRLNRGQQHVVLAPTELERTMSYPQLKTNGVAMPVPKSVAIVGLGPTHQKYLIDVDSAGNRKKLFAETWTFNSFCNLISSDRLFHMDDVLVQERRAKAGNKRVGNMLEAMKEYQGPIYTCFPEPEYPTMVQYPIAEVLSAFDSAYFTTTPPYALAYAMYIGVSEVYLYGCDYTWPGIAGAEEGRAGMEFWVGMAKGRGVKISVCHESSLLNSRLCTREDIRMYGYDRVKISLEERDDEAGKRTVLVMREKELPTAEEIEARYSHQLAGSGIQLDVVN